MRNRMTQNNTKDRPDCEKILEAINLWTINENEFEFEANLIEILKSEVKKENFYSHYIILSRYIEMKFKDNEILNLKRILEFLIEKLEDSPTNVLLFFQTLCDYTIQYRQSKHDLDIKLLEKILEVTIKLMESFPRNPENPEHQEIQKNALSMISDSFKRKDDILDLNKCIQIAINSLLTTKDKEIKHMSIELCSKHIKMLEELFSNTFYMGKIIELLKNDIHDSSKIHTNFFKQILRIFTSGTDLSPNNCEKFVEKDGMDLCFNILNVSKQIVY
jgi:hypothetical protein